jgi:predicted deacylase
MKITTAPSSNHKNGSAWRDLHQTDAEFSPAYIGEACNQETANLFAAAPDLLAAIEGLLNCSALCEDSAKPSTECAIENAQIAVRKARGIVI